MGNYLAQLFGPPAPNPSALPPAVQSTPALERRARANGFRNAEEMMLWARQRNQQSGGTVPRGKPTLAGGISAATSMHPKNILSYILGKWQGAMPQD